MTVRDICVASWETSGLEINISGGGPGSGQNIAGGPVTPEGVMRMTGAVYYIGHYSRVPTSARYICDTKAGAVYLFDGRKVVAVDREIQAHLWDGLKYTGYKPVGVRIDQIPKELLDLEITRIMNFPNVYVPGGWCRWDLTCQVPDGVIWTGIAGEMVRVQDYTDDRYTTV